ncbi:MAG: Beta-hydroxyacyl-(acyl-carrier-protein) dehydratase FabA/FabZ [Pedosphaera sp.]|nr:Beta-hydroxyacyl-(acyl-carrier-protein) dehydratase FabA/FabZ [Pedosphaera sp.]
MEKAVSLMNATLTENENKHADLKEGLRRCSADTVAAAIHYRETGDLTAIPTLVFGILERYQPASAPVKLSEANKTMRLIEDIGLDSLTLLEIVMSLEEALNVRVENGELREIRTLGQLNDFLQAKITGTRPPVTNRSYSREQLMLLLPQQPPFLFLDAAELDQVAAKGRYLIKGDEFFLEGHFKDEPVFPASIVFEALGQVACLWMLEKAPAQIGRELKPSQVVFASLDGAHFQRKARPGEQLDFELKLLKLREPLAVFEGTVTSQGERVARIERLVLAFGDPSVPEKPETGAPAISRNGHH